MARLALKLNLDFYADILFIVLNVLDYGKRYGLRTHEG